MPSIGELHHKHEHSRQTVGKAIRILQDEGLIYRVPGLGYYRTEDLQDRGGIQPPGAARQEAVPGRPPSW
jgi:DNA-binding GntR family transcriptional regulator